MTSPWRSRLAAATIGLLATIVAATPANARTAADDTLSLTALAFATSHIDTTTENPVVRLSWAIANTDQDAEDLSGALTMRQEGATPGTYVGQKYLIDFRYGDQWSHKADFVEGTPQLSTYEYYFSVPGYAATTSARWIVTQVELNDGRNQEVTVATDVTLTATTFADTTPPSVQWASLSSEQKPYVYAKDRSPYVFLDIEPRDFESGFHDGAVILTGPGGHSVRAPFEEVMFESDSARCGRFYLSDPAYPTCTADVRLPANAASGTWRISGIELVDNAGNRGTATDSEWPTIAVTSNDTMYADGFVADPAEVNNWRETVNSQFRFQVHGAVGGVESVSFADGSPSCSTRNTVISAAGLVTVTVPMNKYTSVCKVTALAIVDGAGHAAIYGSVYDAPDPGLVVRRMPNTIAPTATDFAVTPTTVKKSELYRTHPVVTMKVDAPIAPVNGYELQYFDAQGVEHASVVGGGSPDANGVLRISAYLSSNLEPGTYRFGVRLSDASGLSTSYGLPGWANNHDLPEGALTVTVTDD